MAQALAGLPIAAGLGEEPLGIAPWWRSMSSSAQRELGLDGLSAPLIETLPDGRSEEWTLDWFERWLKFHDRSQRTRRGVYFTPRPLARAMVRAVDEVLRCELGLDDGLASTATWSDVGARFPGLTPPPGLQPSDRFITILDPAMGSGVFLLECVAVIERTMKGRWLAESGKRDARDPEVLSRWRDYVPRDLLPRLRGCEILPAPWVTAHRVLAERLAESGYPLQPSDRLELYLTDALRPGEECRTPAGCDTPDSLDSLVAEEGRRVAALKRFAGYTVVVGNPPYAGYSAARPGAGDARMDAYKVTVRCEERQIQRLSNDYVKFFRLAEVLLEQAGAGVAAIVSDRGYLDGVLFRDMRQSLLRSFARTWVLDLGGENRRGAPRSGLADENLFEIAQGTAVSVLARWPQESATPLVRYGRLRGERSAKLGALDALRVTEETAWESVRPQPPQWRLLPELRDVHYEAWPRLPEILGTGKPARDRDECYGTGVKTRHDPFVVGWTPDDAVARVQRVAHRPEDDARLTRELGLCRTSHFSLEAARRRAEAGDLPRFVRRIAYRPLDWRWLVYLREFVCEPKSRTMRHLLLPGNLAMAVLRRDRKETAAGFWVARGLIAKDLVSNLDDALVWPLYLDTGPEHSEPAAPRPRRANFAPGFVDAFSERLGLAWTPDGRGDLIGSFGPEDLFAYIYAVFQSPMYRRRYGQFFQRDFPRIPWALSQPLFRMLAALGFELIDFHLMEPPSGSEPLPRWQGDSPSRPVERVSYEEGAVWIGDGREEGFLDVPREAWDYRVGAYQACAKWLTDRKGCCLGAADIEHYRRVVACAYQSVRLMARIDRAVEAHGGWASGSSDAK